MVWTFFGISTETVESETSRDLRTPHGNVFLWQKWRNRTLSTSHLQMPTGEFKRREEGEDPRDPRKSTIPGKLHVRGAFSQFDGRRMAHRHLRSMR